MNVHKLNKIYKQGSENLHVLKDVDLTITKGEILSIIGASGSGKSTLLHLLSALDRPTSGNIFYKNKDITLLDDNELAKIRNREIGLVFQFHHLLPEFTALENLIIPQMIDCKNKIADIKEKAFRMLEEVGLKDRATHKPSELSGGEQQRVALARALGNEPELLLADEPTGNLDSKTSEQVFSLIKTLNKRKGITFVIVTHNDLIAARTDRILRLVDGRLMQ
ncbi:MAG: ABC transporter ATP-binding protein [bacterium]